VNHCLSSWHIFLISNYWVSSAKPENNASLFHSRFSAPRKSLNVTHQFAFLPILIFLLSKCQARNASLFLQRFSAPLTILKCHHPSTDHSLFSTSSPHIFLTFLFVRTGTDDALQSFIILNHYLILLFLLATTMGNGQSMLHEPPTTPLASTTMGSPVANAKPVRSVLRRSKSVQSENSNMLDNISKDANSTRYIPQMNQNKNGLMMPTRPYGSDLSGNGGESQSPQWGWYTNLTPPSPEMYQSHPARKTPSKKENASNVPHNLQKGLQSCVSAEAKPNQVFQNLQNQNAPTGWTSVPI
jgi:hypothetical protein